MQKCFALIALLGAISSSFAQFSPWFEGSRCLYHQAEGNCAVFGQKLFVFNGFTNPEYDPACTLGNGQCISDTLAYFGPLAGPLDSLGRPLGQWQQFTQMPLPVTHVDVAKVDDEIWLVGGFMGDHGGQATDKVQIYDPALNTWRYGPDLPVAHASGTAVQLGRKVYVTHGTSDRGGVNGRHFVFDLDAPILGWQDLTPPPLSLNHIGVAAMRGKIYTVGGQKCHDCFPSFHQASLMVYDPEQDIWSYLDSMPQNRSHIEPSVFAMDGKLYVGGGNSDQGFRRDIIEYDPDSNQWTSQYFFPSPDGGQWTSYWAPSLKPIEDQFVFAHGGLNDYTVPRDQTFLLPIQRNRRHEMAFSRDSIFFRLAPDTVISTETLLWTYSGATPYLLNSLSAPGWLQQISANMTLSTAGDEIGFSIQTEGLLAGRYAFGLEAMDGDSSLPVYSPATIVIVLDVISSPPLSIDSWESDWQLAIPPASEAFQFIVKIDGPAPIEWKVINLAGKVVAAGDEYLRSTGRNVIRQQSLQIPQGLYLLWVRKAGKDVLVKKFIR